MTYEDTETVEKEGDHVARIRQHLDAAGHLSSKPTLADALAQIDAYTKDGSEPEGGFGHADAAGALAHLRATVPDPEMTDHFNALARQLDVDEEHPEAPAEGDYVPGWMPEAPAENPRLDTPVVELDEDGNPITATE